MFDFIILLIIVIAITISCIVMYLNFTPTFILKPSTDLTTPPSSIIQSTIKPIVQSTIQPTQRPIVQSTIQPTQRPIVQPTIKPTQRPIVQPTIKPTQRPIVQPTPQKPTIGGTTNPFVNAINSVFSLQLGSNSEQDSCAARHAAAEPTLAQAHNVWKTGDRCSGGRGAVWSGSPDPNMAARMWLNSPPHASIIRGATRLACGAGPSSAVCIAY